MAEHAPTDEERPGWTAHLDCAGDPAAADGRFDNQLVDLIEALRDHGGCVAGSTLHERYGATFSVYTDSTSVTEVIDQAIAIFLTAVRTADLPPWPIVRCEVMTFAEHDRELSHPNPH